MASIVMNEELVKKLIVQSSKGLFNTPDTLLDFERMHFIDTDGDWLTDEVRIEIPLKEEGETRDVKNLIDSLDEKDGKLTEAYSALERSTNELQAMRDFMAYKGVKFDRDWKNKIAEAKPE